MLRKILTYTENDWNKNTARAWTRHVLRNTQKVSNIMHQKRLDEADATRLLHPLLPIHSGSTLARLRAKTILLAGGKGGIGKSLLTARLGLHLAGLGLRVALLDWDLGMPKLQQQLTGQRAEQQNIYHWEHSGQEHLLFTALGSRQNAETRAIIDNTGNMTYEFVKELFRKDSDSLRLFNSYDVLLIDIGAGNRIPQTILNYLFNKTFIITTPTSVPSSHAYLLTLIQQNTSAQQYYFVCNNLPEEIENDPDFKTLLSAVDYSWKKFYLYRPGSKLITELSVPEKSALAAYPYLQHPLPDAGDLDPLIKHILFALREGARNIHE
ncbi:MAG: P-loop NTPase [Candidatus Margulisbacteria bacterium]|jgi:hypothetical protein|nr:P-loop NTPase [Candidatus Margulisiibacteriota bacterium]